jgi:hypothetical protein
MTFEEAESFRWNPFDVTKVGLCFKLFNDFFSYRSYIAWTYKNHEWVRIWKEIVMAYLKVVSQNLPGEPE